MQENQLKQTFHTETYR